MLALKLLKKSQSMLSSSEDQTIILWDLVCEKLTDFFSLQSCPAYCIKPTLDETSFYSLGHDEKLRKWSVDKNEIIETIAGFSCAFSDECLAISAYETRIFGISATSKNNIIVYDNINKKKEKILDGHTDIVNVVILSESQKKLISAGDDCLIKIWNSETLQELYKLDKIHLSDIKTLCLNPLETSLISGSHDKRFSVLSLKSPEKVIFYGRSRYCINKIIYDDVSGNIIAIVDDRPKMFIWNIRDAMTQSSQGYLYFNILIVMLKIL